MEIIVGKNAGFCYGVERAVTEAKKEISQHENTYCLGEIVHNQNVVDELKNLGIKFIDSIEEARGKTIIRAHGVSKEVYKKAQEGNITLKDLTCPSVLKIHKIVQDYSQRGFFIVLTGKQNHPEVIGIQSYCGEKYEIISSKEEIPHLLEKLKKEENILLISQTTYNSSKFDEVAKLLQKEATQNIEIKKTICPSTEIRQKETEEMAKSVDAMIIIGGKKSSNTNKLYDISCKFCNNVIFISDNKELDLKSIEGIQKIGIMAGASTPKMEIDKVKEKIEKGR